jgi:FAD/FMN-containing dehydrogenase
MTVVFRAYEYPLLCRTMNEKSASVIASLRACIDPSQVLTERDDLAPYNADWRGRYRGNALAVVRAGSADEVAAAVRIAAASGTGIVPQGGNTGLVGGSVPSEDQSEIVISLSRMHRVRAIDAQNATMTVEAGVTLSEAQHAAREAGFLFPLSLASEGTCQIGGNLSTNAGGTAVLRYGNMREQVLGLEVVLPDGEIWDGLRGLRKDNTGYDLKQLFIGAEGTLGIITAAVLKLQPLPRSSATALLAIVDADAAVKLLQRLREAFGDRLTGFEVMARVCIDMVIRNMPGTQDPLPGHHWYALVQLDDSAAGADLATPLEELLATALEDGLVVDATIAQSDTQAQALWALRENVSEAQRPEGYSIKHDISLPVSTIPEFVRRAEAALRAALPGSRFVTFGHFGDGTLHYNLSEPAAATVDQLAAFKAATAAANRIVHDLVVEYGGSISAEHGLGRSKRDEIKRYKSGLELDLMRRIKQAIDPQQIMNPGKVL